MAIQLKRGTGQPPRPLLTGEVAYRTDTRELLIGDEADPAGHHVVTTIVEGPHDARLYAQVSDTRLIPLCIVKP